MRHPEIDSDPADTQPGLGGEVRGLDGAFAGIDAGIDAGSADGGGGGGGD